LVTGHGDTTELIFPFISGTMKRMDKPAGETRNFTQLPPLHAKSGMNKKNAILVLSMLFLVGALGMGVFLVNQNQNLQTPAQSLDDQSTLDTFRNLVANQGEIPGDIVNPGDPVIPGDPGDGDIPTDPGTGKIPVVPPSPTVTPETTPTATPTPVVPDKPACTLQVSVTCQGCSGN